MNNCRGHFRSIEVGGNGHYPFDKCGCDVPFEENNNHSTPLPDWLGLLLILSAIILKIKYNAKRSNKNSYN